MYGDEGRLTIFDGKYAYSEMIGAPNSVTLYLNIWLRHSSIGIERCPYTEEWGTIRPLLASQNGDMCGRIYRSTKHFYSGLR